MTRRSIATLLVAFSLVALLLPPSVAAANPVAVDDAETVAEDSGPTTIDVLGNDTDEDTLTIVSASNPPNGTVVVANDDLTLTYKPDANYNGPDTFTYTITDGDNESTASVDVTVDPVNDNPVAGNDTATFDEDVTTDIDVLDNDTDVDGDALSISPNPGDGAHGTTSVVGGEIRYNPDPNFNGSDSFTYTVRDGHGGTDSGTVNVTIDSVNDDPVADDDFATVLEDSTNNTINVKTGDTDADGDTLTITAVTDPAKGSAAINPGGATVRYTPDPNKSGSDSFDYTVSDGHGGTDVGTVNVTITAIDDDPTAVTDSVTLQEDANPTPIDVLDNDTDPDNDALTVTAVTQGAKGGVSFTASGVSYIPDLNANGSDSFTYTVDDGHGGTAVGTVAVTIQPVNDKPVAHTDTFEINEDVTTDFDVRDNDTDVEADTLSISGSPADGDHGVTTVVSGKIRYVPELDYDGIDTFTYTVSDGHGGTDTGLVNITILPVNDDPVAVNDDFGVDEDLAHPQQLNVLATDNDVDGDALTITAAGPATKGTVTISTAEVAGKFLEYKPFTNKSGDDTFTYTVSDSHGGHATATVVVHIGAENDPPNAVNDLVSVPEGAGPTVLDVLANDSDPDGDFFTILSKTNGAHGTVTITGNGTGIKYNPAGLYVGTDTFTYRLDDGHGDTDLATVKVTIVRDATDPVVTAPVERLFSQTAGSTTTKVRMSWGATDAGSGVKSYTLQVSKNGGTYKTATLPKATSKTVDRSVTTGDTYRFRVRATDKEGNVSAYVYGPEFKATRWSQESSTVFYVNSWTKSITSKALGGSTRRATSTTRSATFVFTGRDVGWIATRATTSGKAHVSIDGGAPVTVDLDISSTAYRRLVYQHHFSSAGTHTLLIQPLGDGRVDIDGFSVLQ